MKLKHSFRLHTRTLPVSLCALTLALLVGCSGGGGGGSDTEQIAAAKALLAKNDNKAAIIQLKSALQKNAKSGEGRYLLGKTLLESGDPVAAIVELLKAQELQVSDDQVIPELARAMLAVGDSAKLMAQYGSTVLKGEQPNVDLKTSLATAYAIKGDTPKSRETIDAALKTLPNFAPAIIMQARLFAAEGKIDEALTLLDKASDSDPKSERASLLKGEFLLFGKRDPDAALVSMRKALSINPNSVPAHAAIANILMQKGQVEETKAEYEQLKKVAPAHPETVLLESHLAFAAGDLNKSRELNDKLLKGMPENLRALELAGATELRWKNYAKAEAHLGQALKLVPSAARPRMLLAQTYLKSGQADKALALLKPVIESPQADAMSLTLAGEAYLQNGDNKRSEEAFARATKIAPENASVRTSAAIAQVARGDTSSNALSQLETLASGDKDTRADLALISARLQQKDLDGALKAIAALEKKTPDAPMPLLLRGRVLLLKKDQAGAGKAFEAAAAKDPSYFPAVASVAAMDIAAGKPELARPRFEAFLKANPKSFQAKMAIAEMEARTGATLATVAATLRDAAKISPTEPAPHLMLVRRLIDSGDAKAGLVAAQDASALLPNNLDIQEALGEAQIAAGDGQRAISTFKKLSSANPKKVSYAVRLADAYRANKDADSAISALKQALEIQPELGSARIALVGLLLQEKRASDALTVARAEQTRNPKSGLGFQLEAEVEASRKNWDATVAAVRSAIKVEPSPAMHSRLHAALNAAGKAAEADKLAADWTKEHPKDPVFRYYMGDLALSRNELPKAEAIYREVIELQPSNALAMNNVAWLLAQQGKPGAVAMAEKANALLPDRAALVDTLAVALEAEKQIPKAIEAQVRALRLQPNDPNMTLRLGKLYIKSGDKARARAELEALSKLGDKFAGQAEVASLLKTL